MYLLDLQIAARLSDTLDAVEAHISNSAKPRFSLSEMVRAFFVHSTQPRNLRISEVHSNRIATPHNHRQQLRPWHRESTLWPH